MDLDDGEDFPDPRFNDFEEVFNSDGIAIGFTLPNNSFVFRYDKKGGWKDEDGNYFNSKGVMEKHREDLSEGEEDDED